MSLNEQFEIAWQRNLSNTNVLPIDIEKAKNVAKRFFMLGAVCYGENINPAMTIFANLADECWSFAEEMNRGD